MAVFTLQNWKIIPRLSDDHHYVVQLRAQVQPLRIGDSPIQELRNLAILRKFI